MTVTPSASAHAVFLQSERTVSPGLVSAAGTAAVVAESALHNGMEMFLIGSRTEDPRRTDQTGKGSQSTAVGEQKMSYGTVTGATGSLTATEETGIEIAAETIGQGPPRTAEIGIEAGTETETGRGRTAQSVPSAGRE